MKSLSLRGLSGLLLIIPFLFQSCVKDKCTELITYDKYIPIYKPEEEIRTFEKVAAREMKEPGKIYYYQNYLMINERNEGIHIFDNRMPDNPVQVAFLEIPGNVDMSVQNNLLYADNYMDLLVIDISNPDNPILIKRQEEVFENFYFDPGQNSWFVGYDVETVTEERSCEDVRGGIFIDFAFDSAETGAPTTTNTSGGNVTGTGGSMARFTITQNRLYLLESYRLQVYVLSSSGEINQVTDMNLNWGMETIFPYQNYLFMGANDGMYIYDNSNPDNPQFISKFEHARTCDPVYVSGNTAFVTLNGNGGCEGFENQLDVLDISNIISPRLIKTYPMEDPKGLSVVENNLFLCDGEAGLKTFDVSDLLKIDKNQLAHHNYFHAYDVIALERPIGNEDNTLLLVIGDDGFYQFDASDAADMRLLSKIPVER